MSWQTDREPIDYLKRRIKYYKGKISRSKNWIKNPIMVKKYGDELSYIIARSLIKNQSFVVMFEKAVKDLEAIEAIENKDF